jgi:MFS transporter, ACS family, tartrate transporter
MDTLEQRTMARVSVRLVPFLILCYFVAYLDRVNVSFAALTMNKDLGLSASAYGLGAGIFFLAYGVFEVPSNLLLAHFGARRFTGGLLLLAGVAVVAVVIVLLLPHETALERVPELETSRTE